MDMVAPCFRSLDSFLVVAPASLALSHIVQVVHHHIHISSNKKGERGDSKGIPFSWKAHYFHSGCWPGLIPIASSNCKESQKMQFLFEQPSAKLNPGLYNDRRRRKWIGDNPHSQSLPCALTSW